jgi:sulfite exporter TauE/SafE
MEENLSLALAFMTGLFGSMHCVGMCGAFVLCVSKAQPRRQLGAQWIYHSGRAMAYGFLGALFGLAGSFVLVAAKIAELQGYFYLLAGGAVVGIGAYRLIVGREPGWLPAVPARLHAALQSTTSPLGLFAFGSLNGLVPCGLLYTMELRAAASADPLRGFALLFVFALGTAPALIGLGVLGARLGEWGRRRLDLVASGLLIALGAQILLRAGAHLGWIQHSRWY